MKGSRSFSLSELAELTQSRLVGNPDHMITDVADLKSAQSKDAAFLSHPRYVQAMEKSDAGVVFVAPSIQIPEGRNFLIIENPDAAFQKTIQAIRGNELQKTGFCGVHPSSVIHKTSQIGKNVTICPNAVIDEGALIGDNTFIGAGAYVGPYTTIGHDCVLHPNVVVREYCKIGNRVILQPGVVVGSCGYGYIQDKQGKFNKLNHLGIVIIEDDVEVGAGTTIDRARFTATKIGQGTKIDNHVVIAHNVSLGQDNAVVSLTGIAGSTSTGNHVMIAGQVGISGHLHIESGTMLSARTGVDKSLKAGKYGGSPAMPLNEFNRNSVQFRRLDDSIKKLKELEKRLEELEK